MINQKEMDAQEGDWRKGRRKPPYQTTLNVLQDDNQQDQHCQDLYGLIREDGIHCLKSCLISPTIQALCHSTNTLPVNHLRRSAQPKTVQTREYTLNIGITPGQKRQKNISQIWPISPTIVHI
jgi:hypothetical protein